MQELRVSLFGRIRVRAGEEPVADLDGSKLQELFGYLLLYRDRPHTREALATLLWPDIPVSQSKSYLRKALWQLQHGLAAHQAAPNEVLLVETEWIQLQTDALGWLDVAEFEAALDQAQDTPGEALTAAAAEALSRAVALYHGDLLEGYYHEWCLFERERYQRLYLIMLDKLMNYCAAHGAYEQGVAYGTLILRCDPAREITHRCLMRLHYLNGNRSEALRQYERCALLLRAELGVDPSQKTVSLYEQISAERLEPALPEWPKTAVSPADVLPLVEAIEHLHKMHSTLADVLNQVQREIQTVENTLNNLNTSLKS